MIVPGVAPVPLTMPVNGSKLLVIAVVSGTVTVVVSLSALTVIVSPLLGAGVNAGKL